MKWHREMWTYRVAAQETVTLPARVKLNATIPGSAGLDAPAS